MPPSTMFAPPGFTTKTWWLGVVWPLAAIVAAQWVGVADLPESIPPHLSVSAPQAAARWMFPTWAHVAAAIFVPSAAVVASLTRRPRLEYAALGFVVGLSGAWTIAACLQWLIGLALMLIAAPYFAAKGQPFLSIEKLAMAVAGCWAPAAYFAGFHAALVVARGGGDRSRSLSNGWMIGAALLPVIDSVSDLAAIATSTPRPTTVFNIVTALLYLVGCIICLFAYAAVSATTDKASRSATAD